MTDFEAADISLTGDATATLTTLTGSGAVYTATITPTTDGDMILQVPAGVAADIGSNTNIASDPHTVSVDVPPTVVISNVPTDTQSEAFDITITFSENVTGFEAADISLTGDATATLTTLTGSGAVYTATITPATDGDVILQVPAGVAADTGGHTNTASNPHTVSVDVPPTVVISNVPTDTQSAAFDITITFSENVTGFEADDILISANASATVNGSGAVYTAEITPVTDTDGDIAFQIRANATTDTGGNSNIASQSHSVHVDLRAPTVVVASAFQEVQTNVFQVTITFSEDVTGFAAEDVVVDMPASVTVSGSGAVYTAEITLTGNAGGNVTVQVPADAAHDAVGNGNLASLSVVISTMGWIPDENLRAVLRDALGLATNAGFTPEDLLDLTVLNAAEIVLNREDPKIKNLTGLEYATELTELYLDEQTIRDLQPLAALAQLRVLSLNDNVIEGIWYTNSNDEVISPFVDLIALTELYLDNNLIEDTSALEPLGQLTHLSLKGNVIDDISLLESLTELIELYLDGNLIEDISVFEDLTQLSVLSLDENLIDEISAFAFLTELTHLSLNSNEIDDISLLAALTDLEILSLEDNQISDVSSLADLVNLRELRLTENPIDDTTPLIGIARRIEADEPIASLIPDEALDEILRDIFDLDTEEHITYADMRSLTDLEATDADVADLSGLEHATALETLDLRAMLLRI